MSSNKRRVQLAVCVVVVASSALALVVLGLDESRSARPERDAVPAARLVAPSVRAPLERRAALAVAGPAASANAVSAASAPAVAASKKTLVNPPLSGLDTPAIGGEGPERGRPLAAASSDEGASEPEAREAKVVLLPRKELVKRVLVRLSSDSSDTRIDALRLVRDNAVPEVDAQVARLAFEDRDPEVRRFASQVLALGDAEANRAVLARLATDGDLGVRANAAYGLALLGDTASQATLISALEEARRSRSPLASSIESALASDELDSPVVTAHLLRDAADASLPQAVRARAAALAAARTE